MVVLALEPQRAAKAPSEENIRVLAMGLGEGVLLAALALE